MKRPGSTMFVLLAALSAMPAKAALSAQAEKDLSCVAVVSIVVSQSSEEQRGGVIAGLMYFLGRLEAQEPGVALETELRRVYAALTPETLNSERQRCGAILTEKGQMLQTLGSALQSEGK